MRSKPFSPRFLRDHRRRLVRPHKLALAFADWLTEIAALLDALGREMADKEWSQVAHELAHLTIKLRAIGHGFASRAGSPAARAPDRGSAP